MTPRVNSKKQAYRALDAARKAMKQFRVIIYATISRLCTYASDHDHRYVHFFRDFVHDPLCDAFYDVLSEYDDLFCATLNQHGDSHYLYYGYDARRDAFSDVLSERDGLLCAAMNQYGDHCENDGHCGYHDHCEDAVLHDEHALLSEHDDLLCAALKRHGDSHYYYD